MDLTNDNLHLSFVLTHQLNTCLVYSATPELIASQCPGSTRDV